MESRVGKLKASLRWNVLRLVFDTAAFQTGPRLCAEHQSQQLPKGWRGKLIRVFESGAASFPAGIITKLSNSFGPSLQKGYGVRISFYSKIPHQLPPNTEALFSPDGCDVNKGA